jgi:hypothetical protein
VALESLSVLVSPPGSYDAGTTVSIKSILGENTKLEVGPSAIQTALTLRQGHLAQGRSALACLENPDMPCTDSNDRGIQLGHRAFELVRSNQIRHVTAESLSLDITI